MNNETSDALMHHKRKNIETVAVDICIGMEIFINFRNIGLNIRISQFFLIFYFVFKQKFLLQIKLIDGGNKGIEHLLRRKILLNQSALTDNGAVDLIASS